MGGQIGVDSRPGEGSRFWFSLPVRPVEAVAQPAAVPLAPVEVFLTPDGSAYEAHFLRLLQHQNIPVHRLADRSALLTRVPAHAHQQVAIIMAHCTHNKTGNDHLAEFIQQLRRCSDIPVLIVAPEYCAQFAANLDKAMGLLVTPCTNNAFYQTLRQLALGISAAQEASVPTKKYADFSALKVLVAEDNPVNQMVITGLLKKYAIEPVVVENGRAAVDYCMAHPQGLDLILMDGEMPVLDGWQAAQQIRAIPACRSNGQPIMITAMTAHVLEQFADNIAQYGMDNVLSKPTKPADLEALLADCYARGRL